MAIVNSQAHSQDFSPVFSALKTSNPPRPTYPFEENIKNYLPAKYGNISSPSVFTLDPKFVGDIHESPSYHTQITTSPFLRIHLKVSRKNLINLIDEFIAGWPQDSVSAPQALVEFFQLESMNFLFYLHGKSHNPG